MVKLSRWGNYVIITPPAGSFYGHPTVYDPRPAKEVLGAAQDQNDPAGGAIIYQYFSIDFSERN